MLTALALALLPSAIPALAPPRAEEPLRVFLRAGPKTHGPGEHDHPLFLERWSELLRERGCAVEGALRFPSEEELLRADVLVMYAAEAGSIHGEERARLEGFLARGGGIVVIHDAVCGDAPEWFMDVVGGAWEHGRSKWQEGELGLCFADREHPIVRGASNFDFEDEIYWDLVLAPQAHVLANSFHTPFDVKPQMWTYERDAWRAFVSIPGHYARTFELEPYRTLLLRGIAWAGRRDADSLVSPEEVRALRYPPGGPKAPEQATEGMVLHEDFEITLVAAEPLVINPISIDWDARGRPWVACTPGYPEKQQHSGIPAHDFIAVLEDRDGDGRMDASTLFHEGLDLVTSLVLHRDGVIVTQAPEILFLRDTDGDGRCDRVETLFRGFGFFDTHAVISNLRWGLDGWIYGTQGYSGNASERVTGADGKEHGKIGNGIFRFLPDGSAIEQVVSYGSNTWGLDFSWDGELFFTMANGSHLRHVVLPDAVLARGRFGNAPSWFEVADHDRAFPISENTRPPYQQIDFVGGFTGAAGCLIYDGGAWPAEYQDNHFVTEPTINIVHRDLLERAGQTFVGAKEREAEFLASTDLWFRPVHLRSGPDGALYVLDFYNQAAVHNDTRGPRHGPSNAAVRPDRDHMHGRIWRVQHRAAMPVRTADLSSGDPEELSLALSSPNSWERALAHRLLAERPLDERLERLLAPRLGASTKENVHRLWLRQRFDLVTEAELHRALEQASPELARNAARIAGLSSRAFGRSATDQPDAPAHWLSAGLGRPEVRVRLETLAAYAQRAPSPREVELLASAWPRLDDDWQRSALVASAMHDPIAFVRASLALGPELGPLVAELARRVGRAGDPARVAALVESLAEERGPLALAGMRALALSTSASSAPPDAQTLRAPLARLLEAEDPELVLATIPLAARWDASGSFEPLVERVAEGLFVDLADPDQPLARRLECLECLLLLPKKRERAARAGALFLDPYFPVEAQLRALDAIARCEEEAATQVLLEGYGSLSSAGRERAFERILERPARAAALLDRVEAGALGSSDLGPHRIFRLRNHPDAALAQRAGALFDALEGARERESEELIAELLPIVSQPGDRARGAELFAQNCASCHVHEGEGGKVGPDLTGMGVHGAAALLAFVVDPSRAVDDAYVEYVARTVDERTFSGVLVREDQDGVVLRNATGEVQIERSELELLRSTGRSPMPTGLETLGAEGLRDIFAFLGVGRGDFRVLPIAGLASASTARGLFDPRREPGNYRFTRFGVHRIDGIPFELVDPARSPSGNDAIVLKGGMAPDWHCKLAMPQRVEIPVGFELERVHVLGGVAAWGFPFTRERPPAARWTWHFADGASEEVLLQDGTHFADWIGPFDVPGSKRVEGLLAQGSRGQLRRFSVSKSRAALVERIVLESFDNQVAPVFLALTAQLSADALPATELWDAAGASAGEPELELLVAEGASAVRIVGGGSSHDYRRDNAGHDAQSLARAGFGPITYTEEPLLAARALESVALLALANNQPLPSEDTRASIAAHLERGGGLLLLHASTWYNWPDWPSYNRDWVGGGSRSHEAFGEIEVRVVAPDHPITQGLAESFRIEDELYRFERDPEGASIQILAIGRSLASGAEYPVLWTVLHPSGRIACTTLGHDARAHENPHYQRLLTQAARWLVAELDR